MPWRLPPFDVLFDRHAARLNGHARRWLQRADAADAVQDAFIVLFEKASVLLARKDVNVGGYLFVTLRYKRRKCGEGVISTIPARWFRSFARQMDPLPEYRELCERVVSILRE